MINKDLKSAISYLKEEVEASTKVAIKRSIDKLRDEPYLIEIHIADALYVFSYNRYKDMNADYNKLMSKI